eukprot:scaffold2927_cov32-Tisochrysis_lutea.AAC.1
MPITLMLFSLLSSVQAADKDASVLRHHLRFADCRASTATRRPTRIWRTRSCLGSARASLVASRVQRRLHLSSPPPAADACRGCRTTGNLAL